MSGQTVKCKLDTEDECLNYDEIIGCGPSCDFYNPIDDSVSPELEKLVDQEIEKTKNKKDITLKISGLQKFDKKHELVILKKHVFEIQSVSPKKIILKYKRKLNKTDTIADGTYVFVNKEDELLIPHKVLTEFDRKASEKNASTEEY